MSFVKIEPLSDLNDLDRGIHKLWIYKDALSKNLSGDYLQKINFSIQDLNKTVEKGFFNYQDIVFIICLVDWIKESHCCIKKRFKNRILDKFSFKSKELLSKAKGYFKAIRSFIVAHPLETNRHKEFSLDGSYICIDLEQKDQLSFETVDGHEDRLRYLDYDGMHKGKASSDFYLKAYASDFHQYEFYIKIGFCLEDVIRCARLCIQELYEIDQYLSKLKKKDFRGTLE